jgi:hypothetical protein
MLKGIKKVTVSATAIIASLILIASPSILTRGAFAQSPSNDDFDSATVVPSLPFSDSVNIEEATTAADDPQCSGNDHTVWYTFTPSEDVSVMANTFGSDYDTTLSVYTGSRGSLEQIACNDDFQDIRSLIVFNAIAGQTYYFMVGRYPDTVNGNLVFNVEVAPPPYDVEANINPTGNVKPKTGEVTVSGTVSCSEDSDLLLFGVATQRAGRVNIQGFFGSESVSCAGGQEPTPWSFTFEGRNGIFVAGRASVTVDVFGCGAITCDQDEVSRTVRLTGGSK